MFSGGDGKIVDTTGVPCYDNASDAQTVTPASSISEGLDL